MRKIVILFLWLLCLPLGAATPKPGVIRVNGNEVNKVVTEISMDDETLILKWNDNTTLTGQIAKLMVFLSHDNINEARLLNISGIQQEQMSIEGLPIGSNIYIYDLQGQEILHQTVNRDISSIDIRHLNTGIYLIKSGNNIMKFVKR